jgi:indolepyruvate ferredoxin oxidoreductase, beta subunit
MSKNAPIISSTDTVKNMSTYPDERELLSQFDQLNNVVLVDTKRYSEELKNKRAGNMILLGVASKHLPITNETWHEVIHEKFAARGEAIILKNIDAFEFGRNL